MELLTLDSNYQPAEMVERYNSLIWTERYFSSGDFKLVTTDINRMLKLMPLESTVTIRESTVPMIVEVHLIDKPKNSAPTLTITGRSFDCVLERRAAYKTSAGALTSWVENRDKESDAAYQVMRQILGDAARPPLAAVSPINAVEDALSMVNLTLPADYSTGTTNAYEITPGQLDKVVRDLLGTNYHGLKAVRPVVGGTKVSLEIYNGANLTTTVVVDVKFDQFDDATYLLSYAGSANVAQVISATSSQSVNKTAGPTPFGLNRRVLYLDISSVKLNGEYGLSENVRVTEFIRSDDSTGSKAYPTLEVVV